MPEFFHVLFVGVELQHDGSLLGVHLKDAGLVLVNVGAGIRFLHRGICKIERGPPLGHFPGAGFRFLRFSPVIEGTRNRPPILGGCRHEIEAGLEVSVGDEFSHRVLHAAIGFRRFAHAFLGGRDIPTRPKQQREQGQCDRTKPVVHGHLLSRHRKLVGRCRTRLYITHARAHMRPRRKAWPKRSFGYLWKYYRHMGFLKK